MAKRPVKTVAEVLRAMCDLIEEQSIPMLGALARDGRRALKAQSERASKAGKAAVASGNAGRPASLTDDAKEMIVAYRGQKTAEELAAQYDVSPMTIRRTWATDKAAKQLLAALDTNLK